MSIDLERRTKDLITVLPIQVIEETPHGLYALPQYVHDVDSEDCSLNIEALKNDKAKAARTLLDYAQAIFEIATTAENLSVEWGMDLPELARMTKNAKGLSKKLKGAATPAKVLTLVKNQS